MLFIEEFTDELSNFIVESLNINNGNNKSKKLKEGWRDQLRTKIRTLADHYGGGNISRSRGPSFIIGDESSSTTASITAESTTTPNMADAEVQVNLLPSTIAMRNMPPLRKSSGTAMGSAEDAQLLAEMRDGRLKHRQLEQRCAPAKAVELRRRHLEERHRIDLTALPYENYDYSEVKDACCENVIGTMPLPTGIAGPLLFDGGELVPIPLSTTEGALVASVSRGCLALNESIAALGTDAFYVKVVRDGMSRAPVLEFDRLKEASACFEWIQREGTFGQLKRSFDETSSYASLQRVDPHLEGNLLFLRFVAKTGDAMGMNMVTKGTSRALALVRREFPGACLLSISGNFCVDKKPSALNWIEGRGKSVVAEAFLPAQIVERVLKTSVERLIKLGHAKLLVGSSAACTVAGGWNAHAANVVAAMFLATGQDAAQVVSSSMCLTQLGRREEDGALRISCTMNCLEVGTVGGGTVLSPQSACLEMLGCRRSGLRPGKNAERLARLICSTVMAGELSLLASQCNEGDLEKTHLRLNRSSRNLVLSNSAYPLSNATAAPTNSPHHLLLSGSPCKKSSSMAAIPQAIPEHLPISSAAEPKKTFSNAFSGKTMTGQIEKKKEEREEELEGKEDNRTRADTKTSSASTTASSNVGRDHRTRSTLSQASAKLVKKASSGHHIMPCGPL